MNFKEALIKFYKNKQSYANAVLHNTTYAGSINDNVLALIHPFYPEFYAKIPPETPMNNSLEYINYKKMIKELISKSLPNDWSKVLFVCPDDYFNFSKYVENKVFSNAFLTVPGRGYVINESEINKLKGKNVFIAGCYVEECINDVITSFINSGVSNYFLLIDNVLFNQSYPEGIKRSNKYLLERHVSDKVINKVSGVKLSEVISFPYQECSRA